MEVDLTGGSYLTLNDYAGIAILLSWLHLNLRTLKVAESASEEKRPWLLMRGGTGILMVASGALVLMGAPQVAVWLGIASTLGFFVSGVQVLRSERPLTDGFNYSSTDTSGSASSL